MFVQPLDAYNGSGTVNFITKNIDGSRLDAKSQTNVLADRSGDSISALGMNKISVVSQNLQPRLR